MGLFGLFRVASRRRYRRQLPVPLHSTPDVSPIFPLTSHLPPKKRSAPAEAVHPQIEWQHV